MLNINRILTVVTMIVAMAAPALADYDIIGTTVTILDGETVNASGTMDMQNGTLDVQVGGVLTAAVEVTSFDGNSHLIVNGTAYIEQMKLYGPGDVIVGDGTNAATLTAVEGFLGKNGVATVTINAGSTMIVDGDWGGAFTIDQNSNGSRIDLVGGRLLTKNSAAVDPAKLIGYGGTAIVNSAPGTGPDAGYTVYTAPFPHPATQFTIM